MQIRMRKVNTIAIMDISGRVVIGDALYTLRQKVREILNEGYKQILLNMESVNYIDSSGIGELVSSYVTICTQGGKIKLVNTAQKVRNLLHITKLLTVFESYTSEEEAIASFKDK